MMKLGRVAFLLLALTAIMQGVILYKQYVDVPPRNKIPDFVQAAVKGTTVDIREMPTRGSADAKVVLVEFSDYQCPVCARYANGAAKELDKEFVATGRMKYAFANNPLPSHPIAQDLAVSAVCAGEQDRYWQMHDALFSVQAESKEQIQPLVENLRLDALKFSQCVDGDEPSRRIRKEMGVAQALGFKGTPAFAVGYVNPKGEIELQTLIRGLQPIDVFKKAINAAISAAKS